MRYLIAILASFVATASVSQDRLVLRGEVIEERTHDRTLISKPGWLRGVHVVGAVATDEPQLVSILPSGWSEFCGKLTSIGGDYTATVQFNQTPAMAEPRSAELQFETEFAFPNEATHQTGGVVLEEGACNSNSQPAGTRRFIASFWNQTPEPKFEQGHLQIVLNMNVARAERLQHAASLGGSQLPVQCDKLQASDALAFNYRCSVFVPEALMHTMTNAPVDFSYQRFYRGRLSKPRLAEIYVGAGQ